MRRGDFIGTMAAAGAATLVGGREEAWASPLGGRRTRLDTGWRFVREDVAGAEQPGLDDGGWGRVSLPHTPPVEAPVTRGPGSPTEPGPGGCWGRPPPPLARRPGR